MADIPLITLEEHYLDPNVHEALTKASGGSDLFSQFPKPQLEALKSLGSDRESALSNHNVKLQVISHGPADVSPAICTAANDNLYANVKSNPKYAAFSLLPVHDAPAAAAELKRTVKELGFVGALINNHLPDGTFYDSPGFYPMFEAAQELDVPIYIHPTFASPSAMEGHKGNFPPQAAAALAGWGWDWHASTGLHFLRLFASGLFDKFPKLKIIIGHMGEMLPFQLDRIIPMSQGWGQKQRGLRQVWEENIWVTTSGMFSLAPLACLVRMIPMDRIMMSVDYPFSWNEKGRQFAVEMEGSGLVSKEDLEGICWKNAAKLLKVGNE